MWPRRPRTVCASPSRENVKTGTRRGYARFIDPFERMVAILAAVLFFSVTISLRMGAGPRHTGGLYLILWRWIGGQRAPGWVRKHDLDLRRYGRGATSARRTTVAGGTRVGRRGRTPGGSS